MGDSARILYGYAPSANAKPGGPPKVQVAQPEPDSQINMFPHPPPSKLPNTTLTAGQGAIIGRTVVPPGSNAGQAGILIRQAIGGGIGTSLGPSQPLKLYPAGTAIPGFVGITRTGTGYNVGNTFLPYSVVGGEPQYGINYYFKGEEVSISQTGVASNVPPAPRNAQGNAQGGRTH